MILNNPYPLVNSIEIAIEASQFGKEQYCSPDQIKVVETDNKSDAIDVEALAKRQGYDSPEPMIWDDYRKEIERYVMEHSHEFLLQKNTFRA